MNTSVGAQNRVAIRRTIDSERDTIEEVTRRASQKAFVKWAGV